MSDDFDREAERERLREKYERDKAKREASEQMSELLLQGATMTNRHCPECHSPVFRYDGKEFCPTCQREITEDGEFADEADEADEAADAADAEAATESTAATNGEVVDADENETMADQHPETPSRNVSADDAAEADAGESTEPRPTPARERRPARVDPPARREAPTRGHETTATASESGDLGEAEAALVREITNLTRRAENTRDVGRKRDLFAAAREAAETLRELRRL